MKQEQDGESSERIGKAGVEESWAVNGYDHSVIGDPNYGEDEDDHDGAETTEGRTELEHVPSHCCSRPLHTADKTGDLRVQS